MSQKPHKSLAEQQLEFKKNFQSQAKALHDVAKSRVQRNYAYDHLQVSSTIGGRHINSYLFSIISFLKEIDQPVSFDEIKQFLKIDLNSFPELLQAIFTNERIIVNDDILIYKPQFDIRSKPDLVQHLKTNAIDKGFDSNCLKEIFPKLSTCIQELSSEKQIFCVGTKDDSLNVLFFNDLILPKYPDQDIKKLWHAQVIPDDHELQSQLQNAGLKGLEVVERRTKPEHSNTSKRPSAKKLRRIKVTNTHLEGLDFSVDFGD